MSEDEPKPKRTTKSITKSIEYLPPIWVSSAGMSDDEFIDEALNHYLVISDDYAIKAMRARCVPLLQILYGEEIERELTAYKKHHAEPV